MGYGMIGSSGKKGYKAPYPGHEAMCVIRKKEGMHSDSMVGGGKKTTEGRKPSLENKGSNKSRSEHGARGYQSPKVKHK
jgi:hypothetical protein